MELTHAEMQSDNVFVRELEVEKFSKTLKIYQYTVGDVGHVVWDAGITLGKYLDFSRSYKEDSILNKTVIELGSGTGVVGLFAAALGGTVNAQVYRDDILDAYVCPYAGATGDAFLLQDGNARPHRARIVDDYLQQETIMCIERPARSPDLNPIKHVSDALGRRLAALNPPPQTLAALATALQEQWLSLPMELIDHIIESITHRCIASRGDRILY